MPEPTPRRSLAARRRTTQLLALDEEHDKENNSLNETLYGRRQSRLFNTSGHVDAIQDEPAQTPTQLVDLYQKTVELATQGKINIKNAFSIPLVERLPQVLNVIALDEKENHNLGPNFVKAGSVIDTSAKIYGFRVDALHSETQKLSGNILNPEGEDQMPNNPNDDEHQATDENGEPTEGKKVVRRQKNKLSSFVTSDISKITLEHEFEFRPLQAPNLCRWNGGIGVDSIYAEMVSSTMYSSSDFPLIDGFTNGNALVEDQKSKVDSVLDHTNQRSIDLGNLRQCMQMNEGHDHLLGLQGLREFSFNECPSNSFIDTIHESCLMPADESLDKSDLNGDDLDHDDNYNHEELVHAAIEDLTDDQSHSNEVFKHALDELSQQDPSTMHSNLGNYQSQQSVHINMPSSDEVFSASFLSNMSFADQMPHLLNSKEVQSEYSYFDANKLKLFAGPNIWKYTNLLNSHQNKVIVQHQQAPAHRNRPIADGPQVLMGPKRYIRVDFSQANSIDQLMSGSGNSREKKGIGISQSALILRVREKSFNLMQLARKVRPLTELTNSYHFPNVSFERLHHRRIVSPSNEEIHEHLDNDFVPHDEDDFDAPIPTAEYDFSRPVHYEKIEFAKASGSVNAKILKRQILDEFTRQKQYRTCSMDSTSSSIDQVAVEFSILCEHLLEIGQLSLQTDLPSAFYCMLINCNEKKLYLKTNSQRDDLFIQDCPVSDRRDLSTLSYSYTSHSNLSLSTLSAH